MDDERKVVSSIDQRSNREGLRAKGYVKLPDWLRSVLFGLGGFFLFLGAGFVAVMDILSFMAGRPLHQFYSRTSGYNDPGIAFTAILILLALLGLGEFILQMVAVIKKLRK